ncbi:hypothetical protein GCM10018773_11150 [Streptomyces candidus]|nr:hypothetical protein GCM10018773_11150 [Streptomyces candidus]
MGAAPLPARSAPGGGPAAQAGYGEGGAVCGPAAQGGYGEGGAVCGPAAQGAMAVVMG